MNDNERILLVESDPLICDQISNNILIPLGYQIRVIQDVNIAIRELRDFTPDVVIVNINLPGLSGKDLMIATSSQGINTHFIVIAQKGQENDILQAVRMGADDYLIWPARDAEVVSVVENCLHRSRDLRESHRLNAELQEARSKDQNSIRQMKMLLAISREIISSGNQHDLMKKLVEGVVHLGGADLGWIYLLQEKSGDYMLAASHNLPKLWVSKLGITLEDGISSMVAMSGECLALHGVSLKRFKVANLGQSAAAVPLKTGRKVIGLYVVVRHKNIPFDGAELEMVKAVAELTSLALQNFPQSKNNHSRTDQGD